MGGHFLKCKSRIVYKLIHIIPFRSYFSSVDIYNFDMMTRNLRANTYKTALSMHIMVETPRAQERNRRMQKFGPFIARHAAIRQDKRLLKDVSVASLKLFSIGSLKNRLNALLTSARREKRSRQKSLSHFKFHET